MVIHNNIIPFKGYKLINLFGVIFARKKAVITDIDLNHEMIHTALMKELLYIFFYLWYVIEFIIRFIGNGFLWKRAYKNIWFEQEAFDYLNCRCYLKHRLHYKWFNYKTMNNRTLNYNYYSNPSCCTRLNYKEDRNKFDPSYPDPKDDRFSSDYSLEYLTFIAKENGTFTFTPQNNNVISYSTDGGETWIEGNSVEVSSGDKVMWKGTMTPSPSGIGIFSATGNFDIQGNIMSLLFGDNYKGQTDLTGKDYAFRNLFSNNKKVVSAENLSLPATTLANMCYMNMFPGCTSLTTAPVLPATELVSGCYANMFLGCTSLTSAPELPATTLANNCYNSMFRDCTSLTTAPELPATTLADYCYGSIFNGCTNLNYIKAMFTTTPDTNYTYNWVNGVAATGTFVKNSAATWNVTGVNGIPTGWTVK